MRLSAYALLCSLLFTDGEWASIERCAAFCMRRRGDGGAAAGAGADGADGVAARPYLASLNAVFLMALFAPSRAARAASFRALRDARNGAAVAWGGGDGVDGGADGGSAAAVYYLSVYRQLRADLRRLRRGMVTRAAAISAAGTVRAAAGGFSDAQAQRLLFEAFFPEGAPLLDAGGIPERVAELRQKRTVHITRLNPRPITHPAREMLFTANVMLTTPLDKRALEQFSPSFTEQLAAVSAEPQRYWFDHPIPIGIPAEENEILYGLKGLNDMMAAEKERGAVERDAHLSCLLSASTTHHGLRPLIHEYFTQYLGGIGHFEHLALTVITEEDCQALLEQVLLPVAQRLGRTEADCVALREIFGVDGEYGRHYSFLKAIAALWQVCVDSEVRATFKIDLDQVFPQKELIAQTGQSALEHFKTPFWGAVGRDYWGDPVDLGMIAGSLVNEADIGQGGLFTPDVTVDYRALDSRQPLGQRVFSSKIPQALSTEAEMLNRTLGEVPSADSQAGGAAPAPAGSVTAASGAHLAAQRVHVTGGTNGILVDALRRHRPFTPTICGRAEDQAYLISALQRTRPYLRYLHKPGLIMRHDKEVFAGQAIKKAKTGTQVGDYVRMLFFSAYAQCHRWSTAEIKDRFDPFTGAFVSSMPITVSSLRAALDVHAHYLNGEHDAAERLVKNATARLSEALLRFDSARLQAQVAKERRGWECYYDLLDGIEKGAAEQSNEYADAITRAQEIIAACRITSASE